MQYRREDLGASLRLSSPDMPQMDQRYSPEYAFVLNEANHAVANVDMLHPPPKRKATTARQSHHHQRGHGGLEEYGVNAGRVLGTTSVVAITFFFGCAGPLGSEPVISMAGPLLALIAFIVYPIVFTFPYGAVVAELCTAFPEDGGFPIAVRNAFGQFWGVQVGYWSWVGNIMSTAIYPQFVLELMEQHMSIEIVSPTAQYFVKAGIAVLFSVPALLGTKFVSRSMILFLIPTWIALITYVIWAFSTAKSYDHMSQIRREELFYNETTGLVESSGPWDIPWFDLLNSVFWNYDGIQMASVFGGQVMIPARVYPRAISITIGLTFLCYILPFPATIANEFIDWTSFEDGSYGEVAVQIGGDALRVIMVILNFVTTIGMFVSSAFCEATELAGMAQSGMIYPILGKRNQTFQSPHYSVILTLLVALVFLVFDNEMLIPVTNAFACMGATAIFLTGVQLRRRFPHFPRPSTVPGGPGVMMLISIIPLCICGFIIYRTLTESWEQFATVSGFVVLGLILSVIMNWGNGPTSLRF